MRSTLLALHQPIHFRNCESYVLDHFSLRDNSISSVAFSKSFCSLYCRLRHSTWLVGGAHAAMTVWCVGWMRSLVWSLGSPCTSRAGLDTRFKISRQVLRICLLLPQLIYKYIAHGNWILQLMKQLWSNQALYRDTMPLIVLVLSPLCTVSLCVCPLFYKIMHLFPMLNLLF